MQCLQKEVRMRFRSSLRDILSTYDLIEVPVESQACQMCIHPAMWGTGSDHHFQVEIPGKMNTSQDTWQNWLLVRMQMAFHLLPGTQGIQIQRDSEQVLQVRGSIKMRCTHAADDLPPFLNGKLEAMMAVDPLPGKYVRRFCVDDKAVEVKNEGL